jgi:ankyrin repeat protein
VTKGDLKIIRYLLRHGADLNLRDLSTLTGKETWTPLETACSRGNIAVIEMLLRMGADPNQGNPVELALTSAFPFQMFSFQTQSKEYLRIAILELLLTYEANVNQRDDDSDTPLQAAIWQGASQCAYRLVEKEADVNAAPSKGLRGGTALQAAAAVGDVAMVEYLLRKGAEVNAPAVLDNGVTALQAAAIKGYLRVAQILLEHGADIDAPASPDNGRTAIDGAAEYGRLDMVQLLLDNYRGPQLVVNLVQSAYSAAIRGNQWHVMDLLESSQSDMYA